MPSNSSVIQRAAPPHTVEFLGVGEREFGGIISTPAMDRYGDIVESSGCRYKAFLEHGTILGQHDPYLAVATPIEVNTRPNRAYMSGLFPEPGVSEDADKYRRLVKARVLNSFSIGFLPKRAEPLRGGGVHYLEWDLCEVSIVSVPALTEAVITERSLSTKRIYDLGSHRYARDLATARRIAARHPRNVVDDFDVHVKLARARRMHDDKLRQQDRAAGADYVMRLGMTW
jgi:hypothetical protein